MATDPSPATSHARHLDHDELAEWLKDLATLKPLNWSDILFSKAAKIQQALSARSETRQIDEHTALQLAAISVASIQNTRDTAKQRIGKDSPYWTQTYEDVCTAVEREMRERERAEAAETTVSAIRQHDPKVDVQSEQVLAEFALREWLETIAKLHVLPPTGDEGFRAGWKAGRGT